MAEFCSYFATIKFLTSSRMPCQAKLSNFLHMSLCKFMAIVVHSQNFQSVNKVRFPYAVCGYEMRRSCSTTSHYISTSSRSALFNITAFTATKIEDSDISKAAISGLRDILYVGYRTPAAIGMAARL